MFCPDAIVWGTIANWVSGLATTFAACVALGVASWNRSKDRTEKKEKKEKEAVTENALLAECLGIYRGIRQATDGVLEQFKKGEISFANWKFVVTEAANRALRLQSFPGVNLRAVKELERIVEMRRYVDEIDMLEMPDVETLMASIVYQCGHTSQRIIENPNPAATLNW